MSSLLFWCFDHKLLLFVQLEDSDGLTWAWFTQRCCDRKRVHSLCDWLYSARIALLPGRAEPFRPADWAVVTITAGLFTFSQRLFPADPSLTAVITQDELVLLIAIACSFKWPPNFSSWNCTVVLISQLSGCNYRVMFDITFCFESREKKVFSWSLEIHSLQVLVK